MFRKPLIHREIKNMVPVPPAHYRTIVTGRTMSLGRGSLSQGRHEALLATGYNGNHIGR